MSKKKAHESPEQMRARSETTNKWIVQQREELKKRKLTVKQTADCKIVVDAMKRVQARLAARDEQNRVMSRMKGGVAR